MDDEYSDYDTYKLYPKLTIQHNTAEIFVVRFSPDGKFLVVGCGDGSVKVYNTRTGIEVNKLQEGEEGALPITAIKFRPVPDGAHARTRNVFIASNTNGQIQHWHMSSGKCLHSLFCENDQIYALDYDNEGTKFLAAGMNKTIRLFDEDTKSESVVLCGGSGHGRTTSGHSNRIFACKFVPDDNNLIISGGWDSTVQIWDVRAGHSVRSFYGPHICGDSLDMVGNNVLTGSWRSADQLEIWDFRSGKRLENINWYGPHSHFGAVGHQPCMVYAAQFSRESPNPRFIVAGGSGFNEARVFNRRQNNDVVGTITGLQGGVFAVDFSPTGDAHGQSVAIGGGDAGVRVLDILPNR